MYAYFDKHGKKFLAVLAAVLALVFLLPAGFSGRGGGAATLGKIDGKAVDANEVQYAANVLRSLERVLVPLPGPDGRSQQLTPLPQAVFPPAVFRQLEQNPVLLYLLMREARQAGATADERLLDSVFAAPAVYSVDRDRTLDMSRVSDTIKTALRDDARQLLAVGSMYRRSQNVIKISRPLVNEELARQTQQVKVRVASMNAADYEKAVHAPTADELQRQFNGYKDVPAVVTADNPFGFGYLVPDRISVQWMTISDADVAKAVEASRPAGRWEEDAIIYYRTHAAEFPSTQPTGTTKPVARPYAEARVDVLKSLRAPLIEQKKREVAARVSQALTVAYQKQAKAAATTGPATRTSLTDASFTFEALQAIADTVQKQTGVRPTAVAPAGVLSVVELTRQPGIGQAIMPDPSLGYALAPSYIFDNLKPLHPTDKPDAPSTATLALGQPTPTLVGDDGTVIARVVGVDPAHAADFDAVKADVERDLRRSRAFALAADAAKALLDKANAAGGLTKTDAKADTSGWINSTDVAPAGLTGDWTGGIVGPAFEALRGLTSVSALPVRTLAKLSHDGRAVVVEVFDVKTTLTTRDEAQFRDRAEDAIARNLFKQEQVAEWFAFDNVSRRVGYEPGEAQRHEGPADSRNPRSPNNPANPFLPG